MSMPQFPTFVAHRGYPRRYPENTLAGFEAAITAGALFLECDVQLCRDMVPVLFHDHDLNRVCGVPGAVHMFALQELQKLSAAEQPRFGKRFLHEPIGTLAQLLACVRNHPAVTVFVELKQNNLEHFGSERGAASVLRFLDGFENQAVVISYALETLLYVKKKGWKTVGAVCDHWQDAETALCRALDPDYLFFDIQGLPKTGRLDSRNAKTVVFEVADWSTACALTARGAFLIETCAVGEMLAHLTNTHAAGAPIDG